MEFEVVKSLRNPGGYACEAIDDAEGTGVVVEFFSDQSEVLAREYAKWKNSLVVERAIDKAYA